MSVSVQLPEFVRHKDDPALQQQRGKYSYDLSYAEAAEQTVKVHMFQSGIHRPPELNDLVWEMRATQPTLSKLDDVRSPSTLDVYIQLQCNHAENVSQIKGFKYYIFYIYVHPLIFYRQPFIRSTSHMVINF